MPYDYFIYTQPTANRDGEEYSCFTIFASLGFGCIFCLSIPAILMSFDEPWFVSTNVNRINACCQVEFNITVYLFKDYQFSKNVEKTCYSCRIFPRMSLTLSTRRIASQISKKVIPN